jgi:hypothetical protein
MFLKSCLPKGIAYLGLDAFPVNNHPDIVRGMIEDRPVKFRVDTVCAFAVLDNVQDFDMAIYNMKEIAQRNIVILTGIGIEVDMYHTYRLEMSDFERTLGDWPCTYKEELSPKVFLLEFTKP